MKSPSESTCNSRERKINGKFSRRWWNGELRERAGRELSKLRSTRLTMCEIGHGDETRGDLTEARPQSGEGVLKTRLQKNSSAKLRACGKERGVEESSSRQDDDPSLPSGNRGTIEEAHRSVNPLEKLHGERTGDYGTRCGRIFPHAMIFRAIVGWLARNERVEIRCYGRDYARTTVVGQAEAHRRGSDRGADPPPDGSWAVAVDGSVGFSSTFGEGCKLEGGSVGW